MPDGIYTLLYRNDEYRWWNPMHWIPSRDYFNHNTLAPIEIYAVKDRVYITSDSIGHELCTTCMDLEKWS